jgi:glucuronoxylan 4-O-methyltransferase
MEYYTDKIQLHKCVINDIFDNITSSTKMLVFGLGYDSKMWYEGNNKNTFFVEDNKYYVKLNENDIPSSHIIQYKFETTCEQCMKLTNEEISNFVCPPELITNGPFDIILIDGPQGWNKDCPGRLI